MSSLGESGELKIMAYNRVNIGGDRFDEIAVADPVLISNENAVIYIEANKDDILNLLTFKFTRGIKKFELANFVVTYSPANTLEVTIVDRNDLTAQTLSNALSTESQVVIHFLNGRWAPNIYFPLPESFKSKQIFIVSEATYSSLIHVNSSVTKLKKGQQLMYISDGSSWVLLQ